MRGSFRPPIIFFRLFPARIYTSLSLSFIAIILHCYRDFSVIPHLFLPLSKPVGLLFFPTLVDNKLFSVMSESSWAFSPQETFFKQISGRVAGWFAAVKSPVLVNISNKGPNPHPEISGSWDQLMASSPPQSHSLAAFTAGKFTHQKGALMSSLLVRLVFNTSSLKIKRLIGSFFRNSLLA